MNLGPRLKKKANTNLNPYLGLLTAHRAHHRAARTRVDRNGVVLVAVAVHRFCAADTLAAYVVLLPSEQSTSST